MQFSWLKSEGLFQIKATLMLERFSELVLKRHNLLRCTPGCHGGVAPNQAEVRWCSSHKLTGSLVVAPWIVLKLKRKWLYQCLVLAHWLIYLTLDFDWKRVVIVWTQVFSEVCTYVMHACACNHVSTCQVSWVYLLFFSKHTYSVSHFVATILVVVSHTTKHWWACGYANTCITFACDFLYPPNSLADYYSAPKPNPLARLTLPALFLMGYVGVVIWPVKSVRLLQSSLSFLTVSGKSRSSFPRHFSSTSTS